MHNVTILIAVLWRIPKSPAIATGHIDKRYTKVHHLAERLKKPISFGTPHSTTAIAAAAPITAGAAAANWVPIGPVKDATRVDKSVPAVVPSARFIFSPPCNNRANITEQDADSPEAEEQHFIGHIRTCKSSSSSVEEPQKRLKRNQGRYDGADFLKPLHQRPPPNM